MEPTALRWCLLIMLNSFRSFENQLSGSGRPRISHRHTYVGPFESRRPRLRSRALLWPLQLLKLAAVIIFKERNGILGERIKKGLSIPSNVRVQALNNGWMTATEYRRWLEEIIIAVS